MSRFWTVGMLLGLIVVGGCFGDDLGQRSDAGVQDTGPDASTDLFGETCPVPSEPGHFYLCHDEAGACIKEPDGNHCRPFCRDNNSCAWSVGRVYYPDPDSPCVCVPPN